MFLTDTSSPQVAVLVGIICIITYLVLTPKMTKAGSSKQDATPMETKLEGLITTQNNRLTAQLRKELPLHIMSLPSDQNFNSKMGMYWAQQAREYLSSCIISPESAEDLSTAIKLINRNMTSKEVKGSLVASLQSVVVAVTLHQMRQASRMVSWLI